MSSDVSSAGEVHFFRGLVNGGAAHLLERALAPWPGRAHETLSPDDRLRAVDSLGRTISERELTRITLNVPSASGPRAIQLVARRDGDEVSGVALDVTDEVRHQRVLSFQHELLKRIASDEPLPVMLDEMCRFLEQLLPGSLATALLVEPVSRVVRFGASPTLAPDYLRALEGQVAGPETGTCGASLHAGRVVVTPDVTLDVRWKDFLELAHRHGLRSCWSAPFFDVDGRAVGTLALYFREVRDARAGELPALTTTAQLAGIATQRVKAREELRKAQAELQQAARLEAVGQLAGGVAHDFNNLLTVIQAAAGALTQGQPADAPGRGDAELILEAAQRGAAVTRQLLAFGRKAPWQPVALDFNHLITRVVQLLRHGVRADVQVLTRLAPGLPTLYADAAQLEQVVVNLVLNACDALTDGGRVELETAARTEPGAFEGIPGPVEVVRFTVRDTGPGLDEATTAHIFEPFSGARGPDRGLGLASVYGIVRRAQGNVTVTSHPGAGTTFVIELPVLPHAEPAARPRRLTPLPLLRNADGDVVVLAEDDALVRSTTSRHLRGRGFEVVECENGARALEAVTAREGKVALVLTDVVMPQLGGPALEARIRERWPDVPVLLMSGYTDDLAALRDATRAGRSFLAKPFTLDELLREVDRAVGRWPRPTP